MENSEKRVRQSGNIAENLTLVTLTLLVDQDIVILAQDSANFHKNELPMPIDRKYHK